MGCACAERVWGYRRLRCPVGEMAKRDMCRVGGEMSLALCAIAASGL